MGGERQSLYYDNGRQGFVYVLRCRFMVDPASGCPLLKVGATRKHPLQRARELSAGTGVPEEMTIAYFRDFTDAFLAETLVHEAFDSARVNGFREFFAAPLNDVIGFIDGLVSNPEYQDALSSEGVCGGEARRPVRLPATPWATLFASFDPDGPPELTAAEQAQCRALEASLAQ